MDLKITTLFSLEETIAGAYLDQFTYPWEALSGIEEFIIRLGSELPKEKFTEIKQNVWAANSSTIAETSHISGPCIIDEDAEIRHCAFIRGNAIIGKKCVVGNSTELKNVILFNKVQVPHYNYVGDSILGFCAHMGAGSITSNVKGDKSLVVIKSDDSSIQTQRKKVGAFLGDNAEIGCNSVLNPGTVIGKNSTVYPLSMARGCIDENCIFKKPGEIVKKRER